MFKFLLLVLFNLFCQNAFANYYEVETDHLKLYIHKDIAIEDFNSDSIEEIYHHVDSYLGLQKSYSKKKVYVTLCDINKQSVPMSDYSRDSDPDSIVRINYSNDYELLDSNSFKFFFCYELSKQLIRMQIKDNLQPLLYYIDYIIGVREAIYRFCFHKFFVKGIALQIAREYLGERNLNYINNLVAESAGAIDYSYIEGNSVRYPICPHQLFYYLREDDFHLKYLLADFLNYIEKKYGKKKIAKAFHEVLCNVQATDPINKIAHMFGKNIYNQWWSAIDKSRNRKKYSLETKNEKIYNLAASDSEMYHLKSYKDINSIIRHRDNKVIYSDKENVACLDVFGNDIYFTTREPNIEEDCFRYNLYKNGKLVQKNVAERFKVTNKGIYWIENHGLRDLVKINKDVVLPLNLGIKVESLEEVNGELFISGAQNNGSYRIYNITSLKEVCEGYSLCKHGSEIYFISGVNEISRLSNGKIVTVYSGKPNDRPISEILIHKGILFARLQNFKNSEIVAISEQKLDNSNSKRISNVNIEQCSVYKRKPSVTKKSYTKVYPDFSIGWPSINLGIDILRGELLKVKHFELNLYWSIMDTILYGIFNPQIRTVAKKPICIGNELYFIFGAGLNVALWDSPDDNNINLYFELKFNDYKLVSLPRMGIRGTDLAKFGIATILDSKIYLFHYYGTLGKEAYLPNFDGYKIVNIKDDKGITVSGGGLSYLIMGIRESFNLNWNAVLSPYKLKLDSFKFTCFAYHLSDFVKLDGKMLIGVITDLYIQIYGRIFDFKLLLGLEEKLISRTDLNWPEFIYGFNFNIDY